MEAHIPLGVQRSPGYRSSRFELEAGSVVAFFTDGLIESLTVPIHEGMARLLQVVEKSVRPGPVAGLAAAVIDAMVPDRAQDDIALLIGRVGWPPAVPGHRGCGWHEGDKTPGATIDRGAAPP